MQSAESDKVLIIDFGMSKFVQNRQYFEQISGTPYYVAPEVIQGRYCEHCDMSATSSTHAHRTAGMRAACREQSRRKRCISALFALCQPCSLSALYRCYSSVRLAPCCCPLVALSSRAGGVSVS